ncbi:MAG: hypothetical protein U9R36_04620, partial [Elusimicrobiota bacterium]|nr:hypothetical protein [Elusimicrobiota bacterium]
FIDEGLVETSVENWGVVPAVMAADEEGSLIEVSEDSAPGEYGFYGRRHDSDTNILDIILPPGYRQRDILRQNRRGRAIEISALRKR